MKLWSNLYIDASVKFRYDIVIFLWNTGKSPKFIHEGEVQVWLTHCGLVMPYGHNITWPTLAEVMACCLTAPSHYLNQCWLSKNKMRAISQNIPQPPITKSDSKFTFQNFLSVFLVVNELLLSLYHHCVVCSNMLFCSNSITWLYCNDQYFIKLTFRACKTSTQISQLNGVDA